MEAGFDLSVSGTCYHKLQLKLNISQIVWFFIFSIMAWNRINSEVNVLQASTLYFYLFIYKLFIYELALNSLKTKVF